MEPNPTTPDPAERPSSVTRAAAPVGLGSSFRTPAPPGAVDETPTIISLNRPRPGAGEVLDNLQGKKLGHFELLEPIGVGGMAAVIRANDLQLGRVVALKILPPEMAVDPENITRFKQEARSAARLDHENIARVYFCGEDQGLHFIAFEYVEGTDLRSIMVRGGPLPAGPAVKYMLQVAAGLAHAASRGVVHRDIKPSNIIITPEGRAKIVDMGLARHTDVHGGVTQSGVTLGTFDYISPEQAIEPRSADVRSDIYSLGCTFYHLLTGQPPVPEGTAAKKLHHHQHVAPVDPRELNPAVPDDVVAVLGRMIAKDPRDRYQRPEHLIQHLLAVAQKLDLPADGSSPETVLFVDAPLPQRRRSWPVLEAVAAVAVVAILAAILGTGSGTDARPSWTVTPSRTESALAGAGAAPAPAGQPVDDHGPKAAANVRELAQLLEQKVKRIVLTGEDYDLAALATTERGSRPLTIAHDVRLEGRPSAVGKLPVLRSSPGPRSGREPEPDGSATLLNIVATSRAVQVELENIRFVARAEDRDAPLYAVAAIGAERLTIANCEFTLDSSSDRSGWGGWVRFDGGGAGTPLLDVHGCSFARGAAGTCAIEVANHARVRASQCAFGPHEVVFLFSEKSVPAAANPDRVLADLDHCTVMMREGTIFSAGRNVSGTIRAADCLFARGGERGEVVLVREASMPERDARPAVLLVPPEGTRNVFSGLVFWATPNRQAATPEECRQLGLLRDAGSESLVADRPWLSAQPLDLVDLDRPRDAFAVNVNRPDLRGRLNPNRSMIGVEKNVVGDLYRHPLPSLPEAPTEAASSTLIVDPLVDPNAPANNTPRAYKTIGAALEAAPPGEVTVLIRHTGPLPVRPQVLAQPNLRLTIKPSEGHRPILTLARKADTFNPAMFSVHNGSIVLRDLQFLLRPAPDNDSNWVSVVSLTGAGQVAVEGCAATFDTNDGTQPVLVTLTSDADAGPAAADQRPKVRLTNCFVRGRGHVVAVRGSRPFELEANNVLAALRGSFVVAAGQPREAPLNAAAQLTLKRVTSYLTEPFLELRAAEAEKKAVGLVPTQVRCDYCLLVAAADKPLVFAHGLDRETLVKPSSGLLTWAGEGNIYGNFQKWVDTKVNGTMMLMTTDWGIKEWTAFTHEPDDSSARVSFTRTPADNDGYLRAVPTDYRPKLTDMMRKDVSADVGASVNDLPKIDELPRISDEE